MADACPRASRAVTWDDWYDDQLRAAQARPRGGVYAQGLRRGFEGPEAVPDPEHERLMEDGDWRTSSAYREGLLTGMNLKVWSTWFGPPT